MCTLQLSYMFRQIAENNVNCIFFCDLQIMDFYDIHSIQFSKLVLMPLCRCMIISQCIYKQFARFAYTATINKTIENTRITCTCDVCIPGSIDDTQLQYILSACKAKAKGIYIYYVYTHFTTCVRPSGNCTL